MRQESVRRTPYGKEHRGTQYGYRAAGKGGAQVQPAQYSYPAGAQAQGARHRHRRGHTTGPGLVGRAGHDTAPAGAADEHRAPRQLWVPPDLD